MTKIAVFGTGQVGDVLANAFLALGDSVKRASRDPAKLDDWKAKAPGDASVASFVFRRVRVRGPCGRARRIALCR